MTTPPDRATILIANASNRADRDIRDGLRDSPLVLETAVEAAKALEALRMQEFDLIISELRLPDASGFGLCRRIRESATSRDLPVLLVSEWSSEMDRILAFECGADDFLARPFYARELSSRVSNLLRRRSARAKTPRPIESHGAEPAVLASSLPRIRSLRVAGERVDLTPRELAILRALSAADGRIQSRSELIQRAWPDELEASPRTIDAHIKNLRRKLRGAGANIETVRGLGYRFTPSPDLTIERG